MDFYLFFMEYANRQAASVAVKVTYAFQTNGLLIDEAWCLFFNKYNVLVGLSLDGQFHDENRLDAKRMGTAARVLKTKQLLEHYQVDFNILWVLTAHAARHPAQVWKYLLKNKIRYVQFIPCLGDLDASDASDASLYRLTLQRFASFYTAIFSLWKEAFDQGNYVSIKLIDDLVHLFALRQVNACGLNGKCGVQCVVEADGTMYPCDFYALDQYKIGNLTKHPLSEMESCEKANAFIRENIRPAYCDTCPYLAYCGGGCKRMRKEIYVDDKGAFCGMQTFLHQCLDEMMEVAGKVYGGK